MKRLLLVSVISLFSASIHAMNTMHKTLITVDNINEVKKLSNGAITVTVMNIDNHEHNAAMSLMKLSNPAHTPKAVNAIILVPAGAKRSIPTIKVTPAPNNNKENHKSKRSQNKNFLCVSRKK